MVLPLLVLLLLLVLVSLGPYAGVKAWYDCPGEGEAIVTEGEGGNVKVIALPVYPG